jgi:nucleoside-diphosphate-sugar epimerase
MKVFVAGATGVLGSRVVKMLTDAGHEVTAVARSERKERMIEELGARPVRLDLFDASAVRSAVEGHEVVMNLATHIPPTSKMAMARAWKENDRIRTEVSRTLVDAALAAGVDRYVQESIGFFYVDSGDRWIDESTPLDLPKHAQTSIVAEREAMRFAESGRAGVALRFAMFYCPDSEQTQQQIEMARRGISPFFGPRETYQTLVHVDDAATGVLAALAAPSGIYNVAENEPLTKGDAAAILAEAVGRKRLRTVPSVALSATPATRALLRSQRVSNRAFRDATAWEPRYPSVREGIPATVHELEHVRG